MTSDPTAPEPAATPKKKHELVELGGKIHEALESAGIYLLKNRGWLFALTVVIPLLGFLASLFGLPARIYFAFNPAPTGAADAAHVAAAEMMINASVSIIFPLATLLTTAGLVANGLVAKIQDLDKFVRTGHETLTSERRDILTAFMKELRQGAREIGQSMSQEAHRHMKAFVPAWVVVMTDDVIRDQLASLVERLHDAVHNTLPQDRIIARSLVKGVTTRFARMMDKISDSGAFMEPTERVDLTNELSHATRSYHVVYWGVTRIKEGTWKWHPDYLEFLSTAATEFKDVTWTFIIDEHQGVGEELREQAVKDVKCHGVQCFVFDKGGKGDLKWEEFEDFFKKRGPFFEVFGSAFRTPPKGITLTDGKITWKATAFGRRVGQILQPLSAEEAEKYATQEGVWAADDIDKVVRAGMVSSATDTGFRVLNQLHKRREPA